MTVGRNELEIRFLDYHLSIMDGCSTKLFLIFTTLYFARSGR